MEKPSMAAKRTNPMLVVTLIAPEAGALAGAAVRSETGGPVAVASTPPLIGPLSATVASLAPIAIAADRNPS